jgi:hypothetical protein
MMGIDRIADNRELPIPNPQPFSVDGRTPTLRPPHPGTQKYGAAV